VHKYSAIATEVDGFKFPSKLEADTYSYLRAIHDAGGMANLRLQHPYPLHGQDGSKVCSYVLDFQVEFSNGDLFAVESKGVMTPVAKLKLKLFSAEYQVPLLVVTSKNLKDLRDALYEVLSVEKIERESQFRFWLNQQIKPVRKRKSKSKKVA